jgi:uncharacterized protein YjbJ (UPF0337 family)
MDWDQVRGEWLDVKEMFPRQWGRLTEEDLSVMAGRREHLLVILGKRYGQVRVEIERQVREFENRLMTM